MVDTLLVTVRLPVFWSGLQIAISTAGGWMASNRAETKKMGRLAPGLDGSVCESGFILVSGPQDGIVMISPL